MLHVVVRVASAGLLVGVAWIAADGTLFCYAVASVASAGFLVGVAWVVAGVGMFYV